MDGKPYRATITSNGAIAAEEIPVLRSRSTDAAFNVTSFEDLQRQARVLLDSDHFDWGKYEPKYKVGDTRTNAKGQKQIFNKNSRWENVKGEGASKASKSKKTTAQSATVAPKTPEEANEVLGQLREALHGEEKPAAKPKSTRAKKPAEKPAEATEEKPKRTRKPKAEKPETDEPKPKTARAKKVKEEKPEAKPEPKPVEKEMPPEVNSAPDSQKTAFSVAKGGSEKANKEIQDGLADWQKDGYKRWEKDRKTYAANYGILSNIAFSHAESPENTRILKDDKGDIQSAATVTEAKDSMRIEYLATAPWNVKGGEKKSVKGAGTKMIEEIIQESIKKGKGGSITLEALDSAIPFYEKIGFRNMGENDEGAVEMKLDSNSAKEFLKRRGVKV
jgi:hypothetical protein